MRSTTFAMMFCAAALAVPAHAQTPQAEARQRLHLPAQPLGASLRAVGVAFGRNVSAPPELIAHRVAPAIEGRYSFEEAIAALLAGTGLRAVPAGGGVAIGRDTAAREGADAQDADAEVVVTGTQIRGGVPASTVVTARREDIRAQGQSTLAELARSIPQSFGGGQNPGLGFNVPSGSGANVGSGASFNLRGLGSDATLTLLDGRRLPYSASGQSIDVSAIPLAAIDRVEIMPAGASALYGSDAVAGVVNMILRPRFEGLEARAELGGSTDGGNFRQLYGALAGFDGPRGGLFAGYEFEDSTAITSGQRAYGASRPGVTLYPAVRSHRALAKGRLDPSEALEITLTGLYNKRDSALRYAINPAGDLAVSHTDLSFDVESFAVIPALSWSPGDWRIVLSGTLGSDVTGFRGDSYTGTALASSVTGRYRNRARSVEIGGDGPLFALPGGQAKLALGAGGRWNRFERVSVAQAAQDIEAVQDSLFAYAELGLPVLGPAQAGPFLHRLSLSAAVRYERYAQIDDVATPKLGLVYEPTEDLAFKASWGKSFRAPSFIQQFSVRQALLYPAAVFSGTSYPAGSTVLLLIGGNRELAPERATSWSLSLALHPRAIPELSLELAWFRTVYRDRVVNPIPLLANALSDPLYREQVTANPAPAQQDAALVASDQFINVTGAAYDPGRVVAIVDSANVNAGRQRLRGLDALLRYRHALGARESLTASINASYLASEQQVTASQPVRELAGFLFNPPHFRGRATLGWQAESAGAAATLSRIGGVEDSRRSPSTHVRGMTMVDLSGHVRLASSGPLADLELRLTAQNLFDARPATIATTLYSDTPYDSTNYSPFGRVLSIAVSKQW
jgi:outer membrane receptor protein involved in Fe transport